MPGFLRHMLPRMRHAVGVRIVLRCGTHCRPYFPRTFLVPHMGVAAGQGHVRPNAAFGQPDCNGHHHFHHEADAACQHFSHFLERGFQYRAV